MRFAVRHETWYRYSEPVSLAPHVLRLSPRGEHRFVSRSLVVRPEPIEWRDEWDAFGNPVTRVTFSQAPTAELAIESRFEVDTAAPWPPTVDAGVRLPWTVPLAPELAPFLPAGGAVDPAVAAFARTIADEAAHQPLAFLDTLCRTMYGRADRHIRPTGDAQSAAETLATWRGACRDYTVLFLAAARALGLPGRFCSGYQSAADTPDGQRYLHAWPEVFVPGAGWRGWDPTHGIPVADGHVALCAAPTQADTMPVTGGYYYGRSITSTLDFSVNITTSRAGAIGS